MRIDTVLSAVCGGGAIFLIAFGAWTLGTRPQPRGLLQDVVSPQTAPGPSPAEPAIETPSAAAPAPSTTAAAQEAPQSQVLYADHQTDELVKEYLRRRYALSQVQQQPPPPQTVQQNPSALLGYLNSTGAAVEAARQASDAAIARMNAIERARFEAQKKSVEQQQP